MKLFNITYMDALGRRGVECVRALSVADAVHRLGSVCNVFAVIAVRG